MTDAQFAAALAVALIGATGAVYGVIALVEHFITVAGRS